ncbi:MAG: zinc ribbon domain-containing protein [Clostridia bacterium]|nr:zinc ribbon domain-containing protein [Clostridia bacterium]
MKSIKPGRGPSGMSFVGAIVAVVFGLFWTIGAASLARNIPGGFGMIFPLFGIIFIILGIVQAVYHYKNATGKDRFSIMDITESGEEGDPSDRWIKNEAVEEDKKENGNDEKKELRFEFCPYCGIKLEDEYIYCPSCGKEMK